MFLKSNSLDKIETSKCLQRDIIDVLSLATRKYVQFNFLNT